MQMASWFALVTSQEANQKNVSQHPDDESAGQVFPAVVEDVLHGVSFSVVLSERRGRRIRYAFGLGHDTAVGTG